MMMMMMIWQTPFIHPTVLLACFIYYCFSHKSSSCCFCSKGVPISTSWGMRSLSCAWQILDPPFSLHLDLASQPRFFQTIRSNYNTSSFPCICALSQQFPHKPCHAVDRCQAGKSIARFVGCSFGTCGLVNSRASYRSFACSLHQLQLRNMQVHSTAIRSISVSAAGNFPVRPHALVVLPSSARSK